MLTREERLQKRRRKKLEQISRGYWCVNKWVRCEKREQQMRLSFDGVWRETAYVRTGG